MSPAYRTGSSSEALSAARRTQLNRGLGLVLGVFAVYALASCFLPGLLPMKVLGGYRLGELAAAAQVLVIAGVVVCHDRHARRHVEPLAQRVVKRDPAAYAEESRNAWTPGPGSRPGSRPGTAATPDARPDLRPRPGSDVRLRPGTRTAASPSESSGEDAPFNAFDSSRAFGGGGGGRTQGTQGGRRAARATT